jgi:nitroimidazol reductase NimA-like FMN-containing flavoprotein (pyridoxamine 5'-phosphate oxidase superfamily)
MEGMTKRELQVTDPEEIRRILDQARVLRLGLAVNNEPYVVPMNYGYRLEGEQLTLYIHSAVRGKKLDMLRENSRVFFEMDCGIVPFAGKKPCTYGMSYSSVMGRGEARFLENPEEKMEAMTILMKTQTGMDFSFDEKLVGMVAVIRIDVSGYTAKHRPIPENLR